jgi:aspartyl-tRNA(Asn)/glutamyl-tRNA(Gln) amidotransferase subunit A
MRNYTELMSDPADLSLRDASDAIHKGKISPIELVDACLSRIAAVEQTIKAFAVIDAERATRDAAMLTEELTRTGPRSPLHGIPLGVKDVIDVGGLPTRAGSHVLDGEPIPGDAPVIKRLRDAGALIIGKTTTHEFACGVTTPPTRNPWNPSRIPGGSSGGSGAAVAAGECSAALGTDSGGSIRVPAAFCGVCGLRPRLGTIPMEGIIPFSWTHDTCGPIGRTAFDVALVWREMVGDQTVTATLAVSHLRVGLVHPMQSILETDSEVEEATLAAAKIMEAEGARLRNVTLPPFREWDVPRKMVVFTDMLAAHQEAGWYPQRSGRYTEDAAAFFRKGEQISGADLALARRRLQVLAEAFLTSFNEVDILLLPTAIFAAPTVEEASRRTRPGQPPLSPDVLRATGPVGSCGLVSISVPSGFSSDGMPLGLQFVARDESTALSAAARFQAVTDFSQERPPMDRLLRR